MPQLGSAPSWDPCAVDRIGPMPHSRGLQFSTSGQVALKKTLIILAVVVLPPVIVVNLVRAAGDWRTIGQTADGDTVSISAVRILKNNQRTALVRVEYKQPAELHAGGPFIEMRARVHVYCSTGKLVPGTEWLYSRDRSGRPVVTKKATQDDQFGKAPEGDFAEMVSKSVCSQSK